MKYVIALMLLLIPVTSYALDKKLGTTNKFEIGIFDEFGNGIAGLTITTDAVIKIQCANGATTTVDGTGDTLTSKGGGYYYLSTNDTIANNVEEECIAWAEGAGNYTPATGNLIAKT